MSKKIKKILFKKNKKKIVCLTAYSKNIAKILDKYCDIILVGDSMANVLYGMKDTNQITKFKSGNVNVEIGINHKDYAHSTKLSVDTIKALSADFI